MGRILHNKVLQVIILIAGIIYIGYTAPNSWALSCVKSKTIDYTRNIDLREGDLIFQHLPGRLLAVIADVTQSRYSHCGIIVKRKAGLYVLEAIGPVKATPIDQWISYGIKDQFTVVRLRKEFQKDIPHIIKQAYRYKGRPYDIQYEMDDRKIYCSELIYKSVKEATGLELAGLKRLGDLNWQPHEDFIRHISDGELPLYRAMITPQDIAVSDMVQVVYSNFPVRMEGRALTRADLVGKWQGSYTLVDLVLNAQARISDSGRIEAGALGSGLSLRPTAVKSFSANTGDFQYDFISENGIRIEVAGRLDHTREGIYGRWRDGLGFQGNFHLTKNHYQ